MPIPSYKYIVITPARDEERYLETTIRSMMAQTVRPLRWVIVNDGSRDRTPEIINRYARREPWISALHLPDASEDLALHGAEKPNRGARAQRAKEILAFYKGLAEVGESEWDFVVKLDADLGFEADYFQNCFAEFCAEPRLGIGGGVICHEVSGRLQVERAPRFHVRGATKIYRRACWEAIGGVTAGAAWDTLDEVKANMLGWKTESFPALRVRHYRFTGSANGTWANAVKNGTWSYVAGYHPAYILTRSCRKLLEAPYSTAGIGLAWGYAWAWARRTPKAVDAELMRYLRDQQLRRLTLRRSIWT